jgi:hypothetical protein
MPHLISIAHLERAVSCKTSISLEYFCFQLLLAVGQSNTILLELYLKLQGIGGSFLLDIHPSVYYH